MAPELALERVQSLPAGSIVLDPMAGSGTVLRQAAKAGYEAIGFDMDPLAVLMSRVATTPCDHSRLDELAESIVEKARKIDGRSIRLEWIDGDAETKKFVEYWFAARQRLALRKLASVFANDRRIRSLPAERDALMLAMSRIIVTKEPRASLARDTSRSRPHKVAEVNEFDVYLEFIRSAKRLKCILDEQLPTDLVSVEIGDARNMGCLEDGAVNAVITSPPYLNAIDYMRGHKMSLVWMGYRTSMVRNIRSKCIGAERAPDLGKHCQVIKSTLKGVGEIERLPNRHQQMIRRYAHDLHSLMKEISRVLSRQGHATLVVGNSCLRDVFIRNSGAVANAAETNRLRLIGETERELPESSRSLPILNDAGNALSKRMRTENVMVFEKIAA